MAAVVLPSISYVALAAGLVASGAALLMLAADSLVVGGLPRRACAALGLGASLACVGLEAHGLSMRPYATVAASFVVDHSSSLLGVVTFSTSAVFSLLVPRYLRSSPARGVEAYALVLTSATGAWLMAHANDLVLVFLGLEILSLPLYVLAASNLRSERSVEAGIKYLVLGGFSSAVFVYGIALVYGATGSTNLGTIASVLAKNVLTSRHLLLAGVVLTCVGLFFKVSLAPFHLWVADVYEGSPSLAVAFMASVAKLGGFGALLRFLNGAVAGQITYLRPIVFAVALLSLAVGSFGGLFQRNLKRMLAYSAINHSGFILLALYTGTEQGVRGALVYLVSYSVFAVGNFAVVAVLGDEVDHDIASYKGLAAREPFLAAALAVFLLGQAGLPLTVGFVGKVSVLAGLLQSSGAPGVVLAVAGMVSSAVAAFYYVRVIVVAYQRQDPAAFVTEAPSAFEEVGGGAATLGARLVVGSLVVLCVGLGVVPYPLFALTSHVLPLL